VLFTVRDCKRLGDITISDNVTAMGADVFKDCTNKKTGIENEGKSVTVAKSGG